jgi:phosphatidylserine/phosphatidylglycerophosphate/cardiolipin synthase-like enzyme
MTLGIVTGSTDREWVRALSSLRRRGVATVVVLLDRDSYVGRGDEASAELAAVRHALAEYDIGYHLLRSGHDIAAVLGGATGRRATRPAVAATRDELRA